MKLLISACLLGVCCRYDGASKQYKQVQELMNRHTLIPVCPEQLGGLATPRAPAERQGEFVMTNTGVDVTEAYRRGAEETLRICRLFGCDAAVLKERSPSCGNGESYDGTFSGTLTAGDGVTAELLRQHGIQVFGESELHAILEE